jgi:hypothetical protein
MEEYMKSSLNLKEIEKRAFRSTYQDGLRDIYYGLIVICLAVFMDRPDEGYGWTNIAFMVGSFLIAYILFRMGKKFITTPRLGQVVFGEVRRQKKRTMSIVLGVFVACQFLLLLVTAFGWFNPSFGGRLATLLNGKNELLLVSTIGSLIVCVGMSVTAYFSDYLRGYYIAILMALAVFLIIYFDQPIFPALIGILIVLPGIMLLVRFLKQYPLPKEEGRYE